MKQVALAITLAVLSAWPVRGDVVCPGVYTNHLQGVATDDGGNIYWSFTTELVKTDGRGRLLARANGPWHHGDLTWHDGKVYVAVNLGKFNQEAGAALSFVYEYGAESLTLLAKHEVPEVVYGAGGIEWHDGHFFVVGGLPPTHATNEVYEYNDAFAFVRRHAIASGQTDKGIQTVCRGRDGTWLFGCYGKPAVTLVTDDTFALRGMKIFNGAWGVARTMEDGVLLVAKDRVEGKRHSGSVSRVSEATVLAARDAAPEAKGAVK